MLKKQNYTPAERKAYYMGYSTGFLGYKSARLGRFLKTMPPAVKKSFMNGLEHGFSLLGDTKKIKW